MDVAIRLFFVIYGNGSDASCPKMARDSCMFWKRKNKGHVERQVCGMEDLLKYIKEYLFNTSLQLFQK